LLPLNVPTLVNCWWRSAHWFSPFDWIERPKSFFLLSLVGIPIPHAALINVIVRVGVIPTKTTERGIAKGFNVSRHQQASNDAVYGCHRVRLTAQVVANSLQLSSDLERGNAIGIGLSENLFDGIGETYSGRSLKVLKKSQALIVGQHVGKCDGQFTESSHVLIGLFSSLTGVSKKASRFPRLMSKRFKSVHMEIIVHAQEQVNRL